MCKDRCRPWDWKIDEGEDSGALRTRVLSDAKNWWSLPKMGMDPQVVVVEGGLCRTLVYKAMRRMLGAPRGALQQGHTESCRERWAFSNRQRSTRRLRAKEEKDHQRWAQKIEALGELPKSASSEDAGADTVVIVKLSIGRTPVAKVGG